MKVLPAVKSLHLWLGLILAAQAFLWMASGAVMSVFDLALVRGETNAFSGPPPELVAHSYANPGGVIARSDGATALKLKTFLGRAVYEVEGAQGRAIFDADSGERLSPISRETARIVAEQDFIGDGDVAKIEYLTAAPVEYRKKTPVWRVTFTDDLATRIYVSPETGEVQSRRNKIWRLYDFFWMLHIMDYREREDFNNPLLRVAAVTGTLFAATGMYLVIVLLMRGYYAISRRPRRRAHENDTMNEDG